MAEPRSPILSPFVHEECSLHVVFHIIDLVGCFFPHVHFIWGFFLSIWSTLVDRVVHNSSHYLHLSLAAGLVSILNVTLALFSQTLLCDSIPEPHSSLSPFVPLSGPVVCQVCPLRGFVVSTIPGKHIIEDQKK